LATPFRSIGPSGSNPQFTVAGPVSGLLAHDDLSGAYEAIPAATFTVLPYTSPSWEITGPVWMPTWAAGSGTSLRLPQPPDGPAPRLRAVLGNNDGSDVRDWGAPQSLTVDLDSLQVGMVHDAGLWAGRLRRLRRPSRTLVAMTARQGHLTSEVAHHSASADRLGAQLRAVEVRLPDPAALPRHAWCELRAHRRGFCSYAPRFP
jgi:hypothetical protein